MKCGGTVARHFKNWLRSYVDFNRDTEAPTHFHFWTGVWTIAGALRRRVWIDMRKFQWTPNFYIVLVGPAGVATKSTSSRTGTAMLEKIEGIHFGPQSATWQAMTKSLEEAAEYVKIPALSGDHPNGLPMSAISMSITELGTFLKMDDPVFNNILTSLWDGQLEEWSHETATMGKTAIRNPWVNLIGCTTPTWIQENFPPQMIGGGLASRIVFVYGDTKTKLIPYPDEVVRSDEYYQQQLKLTEDLNEISKICGPYELSAEARTWGREWYHKLWNGSRPVHMASDRYSAYLARKQTHMHKLAIVLAAAHRDELVIELDDLKQAEMILTDVEPHMMKVFEAIGGVDEAKHVAEIVAYVRAYQWLDAKELYVNFCFNIMSEKDFKQALRLAIESNLLKIGMKDGKRGLEPVKRVVN